MVKALTASEIEENVLSLKKGACEEHTSNIVLNDDRSGTKQGCPLSSLLSDSELDSAARATSPPPPDEGVNERVKRSSEGKENRNCLFIDDIIKCRQFNGIYKEVNRTTKNLARL